MPLPLSDGNYFFIYNSARKGYPSVKPGFDFQYNVGWAVLDKDQPTKVLQRCEQPMITPVLPWEVCLEDGWRMKKNEVNRRLKIIVILVTRDSLGV
jgi:predicted GH43/DUF377 family glycosyl hydrolase